MSDVNMVFQRWSPATASAFSYHPEASYHRPKNTNVKKDVPGAAEETHSSYSVTEASAEALAGLLYQCEHLLSAEILQHARHVSFVSPPDVQDFPLFPCSSRQQEATSAIRALEAGIASALADLRYGQAQRRAQVDVARIGCYLMSAYITTVDSLDKSNPEILDRIPNTDLNGAQSILYRRLSANLYRTKIPGEYYHIHGSLDATKTLEMLGLPSHRPDLKGYRECLDIIGGAVRNFTVEELEAMNAQISEAGAPCLTVQDFVNTPHGRAVKDLPPFTLDPLEDDTRPTPFPSELRSAPSQVLQGVRVLELCRVIAGPTIGKALAAQGADVLKVTSPNLPDVPVFQLDVNTGKHTTSLHLRCERHRDTFERLLATADVVIDGYRPGALARMGYGPHVLAEWAKRRGKGFVYVVEDCFGGSGLPDHIGADWAARPGWQQIADCVAGVAWEQGRFMGLSEPVVPPFPMCDYGTGALGCVAALLGLYRRATRGGSWIGRTSLVQYNLFLLSLGAYPESVQKILRSTHDQAFFHLRHDDSVDEVGKCALKSVRRLHPNLITNRNMLHAWSHGFGGLLRWPRDALTIEGLKVAHSRAARPNGFDEPVWEGWEVEEDLINA